MQCTYKRNSEKRWRNCRCRARHEVLHILSVSVVLVTQQAKRMRSIIVSSVACSAVSYFLFPRHFIKGMIFRQKLLNIKCVCFCLKHFSLCEEFSELLS